MKMINQIEFQFEYIFAKANVLNGGSHVKT